MRVKKLILLSVSAVFGFSAFAQVNSIATAYDYMSTYLSEKANGNDQSAIENLLAAKKEIDPVTTNPSTSGLSRAWKRKGEIYYYIFTDQSPRLALVKEGAADSAIHSFYKAVSVEKKENGQPKIEDKEGVKGYLGSLADTLYKIAGVNYENGESDNYLQNLIRTKNAYDALLTLEPKNAQVQQNLDAINSNLVGAAFNTNKDEPIQKYVEPMITNGTGSVDAYRYMIDYYLSKGNKEKAGMALTKMKEKFPDNKYTYISEINLGFENGETDKVGTLIDAAKTKFPDSKADFILLEVNFQLTKGNNEAAIKALDEAIATYKDKPEILTVLYFNSGVIFSQMYTKAEESTPKDTAKMREYNFKMFEYYTKTVELDPKYHPAYNGIANYYIITGNAYLTQADLVPLNMDKEYKALKAKANDEYLKGIDALEKAWALEKATGYKKVLIQLYEKTSQYEKKKALEAQ